MTHLSPKIKWSSAWFFSWRLASSLDHYRCRRLGATINRFHLLHFLKPVFVVESFAIGRAIVLILVTTAIGYFVGLVGAVLWNRLQTR